MTRELRTQCARADRVSAGASWESWLICFDRMPIPFEVREPARQIIDTLIIHLETVAHLTPEYFLQFNQLHNEKGSQRLSEFGRAWMPHLGLGVWPDREPPSLWTEDEFHNLAPGEIIRPLMHQVFRVMKPGPARHDAMNTMFGIGSGLTILLPDSDTDFLRRATELLLPRIEEPSFRAYEFYVPLLEAKSVCDVADSVVDEWLCGAPVYIRESREDSGIFILSSIPIASAWRAIGMEPGTSDAEWRLLG